MATSLTMAPAIRFHLSLNVADLGRSVAFYRILFGQEPAKYRSDYAKFELDDPPVVLSLEPFAAGAGGALNHLGFRLPDSATLVAMQCRLEEGGLHTQREDGVECCYALQTKFWVTDPDGTLWECYTLEGDLDHRGIGETREPTVTPVAAAPTNSAAWAHRMGSPLPERLPVADASLDEIRLLGTLNVPLAADVQQRLMGEAMRALRPSGRVFVHALVAARPLPRPPQLPGPAAGVRHVPLEQEPTRLLESGGFTAIRTLKFDASPCFVQDGIEMRELQLEGWKPATADAITGS